MASSLIIQWDGVPCGSLWSDHGSCLRCLIQSLDTDYQSCETPILNLEWARDPFLNKGMGYVHFTHSFYGHSSIHIESYLMVFILLIGRYLYSHWVLGVRTGGIEFYRLPPFWALSLVIVGTLETLLWLLLFVTCAKNNAFQNL